MAETPRYVLQTGDGAGWVGSEEPADLAELTKRLAQDYARFRAFPDTDAYYHVVEERLSASGESAFQRREKNPHAVAARLRLAQTALNNTHCWLDDRAIPDRPSPETPSADEDEDEAGRQLSRLLIWLERAAQAAGVIDAKTIPAKKVENRLTVDLAKMTATLDGECHDVKSGQALRWVKVLAEHPGEWISGTHLEKHDKELAGARADRLKKYLPQPIAKLIESQTGKGARVRLA